MNEIMERAFRQVAPHLAGRPVALRFRAPDDPAIRYGMIQRRGDTAVIDVDPAQPLEDAYMALLHECGHARRHFHRFADSDAADGTASAPSGPANVLAAAVGGLVGGMMELEATHQAHKWDAWARARAEGRTILGRLLALQRWES